MNVLVLGAGQLARMMALATKPLNITIRAYDVGSKTVVDPLALDNSYGDLNDGIAFADVITAEFEHIDHDTLAICEASGKLKPSAQAIKTGGDRRLEKALLEAAGVANAPHVIIADKADFDRAIETLSLPIIFKSALEGYDGKGQWRLKDMSQANAIWDDMANFIAEANTSVAQGIVAEQMIPFDREVSMVGARDAKGNTFAYPITENHHTNGVLSVSIATNEHEALQQQAALAFEKVADALDYVGVLAIEFFHVGDKLLVNEIAPRVHNSGHWTQQGADCSQFENHIRAVCDLPLGSSELVRPTAMVNVLGEDNLPQEIFTIPSLKMHWYGKTKRAGRKMGHINVSGSDKQVLLERLNQLADILPAEAFSDIQQYVRSLG
ncbi:5-(carboxyamino)imidazole ribonucleotide synthase [Thalassotalea agarivorans]|uniref:N5-carboxyaminoimidazole ribonucleotide synthase n=1 Tax=Thalassotalea agarivorans TaxID=349064 RepID=A0A1I0GFV6_THASX|nr:5-(carboxyamino)imidazole ribonucleotide synthase [Thalassotalea agarivorans]SET69165.1 5-(carboxyamino)imidazole ribonucleotide synthase [Thalassotalea agarivorans]